ncbi:hypothetical protein [Streptomyces sp. NBC_01207]|uniref:hypothetical protein n=1 Tax=Streptomyces sp. NBC_01207 TaxID=2903772 RepID=UPI002E1542EF|nr:hypothetical protein OG457_48885 [Streptomyces sp. NBC_01207]
MTVRALSHVELYTKDKVPAVRHLVWNRGYGRMADSVEVDRSSVLLGRGEERLIVTSGWATRGFVLRYGEGIADIAVLCDDAAAIADAALTAGATVGYSLQGDPVVTGIGDVVHTLRPFDRHDFGTPLTGRVWVPFDEPFEPGADDGKPSCFVLHLDPDVLERYAEFCVDVLGFTRSAPVEVAAGGQAVPAFSVGGARGHVTFALVARGGERPQWPDVLDNGHTALTGRGPARRR